MILPHDKRSQPVTSTITYSPLRPPQPKGHSRVSTTATARGDMALATTPPQSSLVKPVLDRVRDRRRTQRTPTSGQQLRHRLHSTPSMENLATAMGARDQTPLSPKVNTPPLTILRLDQDAKPTFERQDEQKMSTPGFEKLWRLGLRWRRTEPEAIRGPFLTETLQICRKCGCS